MKVNFASANVVYIGELTVGTPFLADRKSEKGKGLYMKIDKNSGLMRSHFTSNAFAVNLETGQLREFDCCSMVEKVNAEIIFK